MKVVYAPSPRSSAADIKQSLVMHVTRSARPRQEVRDALLAARGWEVDETRDDYVACFARGNLEIARVMAALCQALCGCVLLLLLAYGVTSCVAIDDSSADLTYALYSTTRLIDRESTIDTSM